MDGKPNLVVVPKTFIRHTPMHEVRGECEHCDEYRRFNMQPDDIKLPRSLEKDLAFVLDLVIETGAYMKQANKNWYKAHAFALNLKDYLK